MSRALTSRQVTTLVPLGTFLLAAYFAFYTGHLWEDFFITFRASQNLVHGHGLVFQSGERVHSFTSPLGTLLPALCSAVVGGNHDAAAIWLFRLLCCGLLAATAALLLAVVRRMNLGVAGQGMFAALWLFDAKIVDFTTNGMETGILLFFLAWTLAALAAGPTFGWRLAGGLGGLMWTRPDAFVFAGALVIGFAIFVWRTAPVETRRPTLTWLARAAVIGGVIYLPWFLWAWSYYGSPVPNTIVAKSATLAPGAFRDGVLWYLPRLLSAQAELAKVFQPPYIAFGGWPVAVAVFSAALTIPAAFYFLAPWTRPMTRALSAAVMLGGFYLEAIHGAAPWYHQVWQTLTILVVATMADDAAEFWRARVAKNAATARPWAIGFWVLFWGVAAAQVALWMCAMVQMRINQEEIEDGVRRPIGEWLHANAKPTDTVLLEPLGYIGYFSGLKMLDYPGLSAPEVTRAIRAGATTWPRLITALQPDWVVLRPGEVQQVMTYGGTEFKAEYRFAYGLNALDLLARHTFFPGRGYAEHDASFLVYRRIAPHKP